MLTATQPMDPDAVIFHVSPSCKCLGGCIHRSNSRHPVTFRSLVMHSVGVVMDHVHAPRHDSTTTISWDGSAASHCTLQGVPRVPGTGDHWYTCGAAVSVVLSW